MKKLLFALFILFPEGSFAQTNNGCTDSTLIRYGVNCLPDYDPMCACDGKTYRNLCYLQNNGILSYSPGICEEIDLDFTPNPVLDFIYINIVLKKEGDVTFYIFDHFGKQYLQEIYSKVSWKKFSIDVNRYPVGIYFLLAQSGENYIIKKMVRSDN